jgi:hypothetical protein
MTHGDAQLPSQVHVMASNYTWDTVTQLLIDALFGNARTDGSVGA